MKVPPVKSRVKVSLPAPPVTWMVSMVETVAAPQVGSTMPAPMAWSAVPTRTRRASFRRPTASVSVVPARVQVLGSTTGGSTVTVRVMLPTEPSASVTVSVTSNVPPALNAWSTLAPEAPGVRSPKSHTALTTPS